MRRVICVAVALVMMAGVAFAVPAGKSITFSKSPMGTVIFDGNKHSESGLNCNACHNPDMFPKMKAGTVQITMNDIYAGKLCGTCHNGTKAFKANGNCVRCHQK